MTPTFRKSLWKYSSIGLHLIGTVVYGFTLLFQEYYNDRRDPRSTYVGDFKYLTYWNLVFQFVFNSLNLWSDLTPNRVYAKKLREYTDKFFFCVTSPFSMFVCLSFWTLNSMDKNSVRNPNIHNRFPHTMNGWMNVFELIVTYHCPPDHKQGILVPMALYSCYTTFMLILGKFASIWIYPFLGRLTWTRRMIFAFIGGIKLLFYYIVFVYFNHRLWSQNRIQRFRELGL